MGNDTANELAKIDVETTLPIFNSLDLENPLNDVSIYSLLFDENNKMIYTEGTTSANTTIIDKYFKQEYVEPEEGDSYYTINYLPSKDEIYIYISFVSDGIFQYCEFETDFE